MYEKPGKRPAFWFLIVSQDVCSKIVGPEGPMRALAPRNQFLNGGKNYAAKMIIKRCAVRWNGQHIFFDKFLKQEVRFVEVCFAFG